MSVAPRRRLGSSNVFPIGLGCMNLSHAYGTPPSEADGARVLLRAIDLGITHFDTAALYGFGKNEALVGRTLKPHRDKIVLASKCGMTGVNGQRVIDGRPETIKRTCDEALSRLGIETIDLYYLHRWDKSVPIEDSVGALADLAHAGKIRDIGLSEVSAATLRRAAKAHPIAAVQSEYSLFSRNPELGVLDACAEIGATFVAFSPLARGLLAGSVTGDYAERDIRRAMPRFNPPHLAANLALAQRFADVSRETGVTPAKLAIAWLLMRPNVVPIPGTTSLAHLEDLAGAAALSLPAETLAKLDTLFSPDAPSGPRYNAATLAEVDTEEFG